MGWFIVLGVRSSGAYPNAVTSTGISSRHPKSKNCECRIVTLNSAKNYVTHQLTVNLGLYHCLRYPFANLANAALFFLSSCCCARCRRNTTSDGVHNELRRPRLLRKHKPTVGEYRQPNIEKDSVRRKIILALKYLLLAEATASPSPSPRILLFAMNTGVL